MGGEKNNSKFLLSTSPVEPPSITTKRTCHSTRRCGISDTTLQNKKRDARFREHDNEKIHVIPHEDAESPTQPCKTKNEMPAFASMTMKKYMSFRTKMQNLRHNPATKNKMPTFASLTDKISCSITTRPENISITSRK